MSAEIIGTVIGAVVLILWPINVTVNALKRKWGFVAFAVLTSPWATIGTVRLARPGSWWYRKVYDDVKRARADLRYGDSYWPKSYVRPEPLPPKHA
jgi:hypothetical protein